MVEQIRISPEEVRGYGNVCEEHTLDDFTVNVSSLSKVSETVHGAVVNTYKLLYSVYGLMFDFDKGAKQLQLQTNEADTLSLGFDAVNKQLYLVDENDTGFSLDFDEDTNELYITDDAPPIVHNYSLALDQSSYTTTGSLSVSATLLDDGVAVEGATVSFTGGVSTVTATTNSSGVATATVTFSASGTLTASYSNVSDTASVTVSHSYSLAFSSSSYVATDGSAEVSVTLLDDGVAVSGATVTFTGGTSTVTGVTNSSGVATATVSVSATSTITATYQNVTDTCTVTTQNIIFDDSTEYTQTITPSGDTRANIIPTFNFDASVDFEMTCDVYFSKDGSCFGLFPSNTTTQFIYHLTYGQVSNYAAIYYGNSTGGESSVKVNGTQSFGVWFNLKFVKEGYQVTTYINNTLFSSNIPTTTLGDHGNMMFAFGFWGSGSHTGKVKNLKIVEI